MSKTFIPITSEQIRTGCILALTLIATPLTGRGLRRR